MYIFFLFLFFVSVYVYASLCDFVCIPLLLPFVLGFCLSVFCCLFFCSMVFSTCYHWWMCFLVWLLRLPKTCVADRVLVLWPGIRPVPLRWESRVQDIGPPETSRLHVISNGKSSPRDLQLNNKTQLH